MKKILLVCAAILALGAMAACKNGTSSETDTTRNEDTCQVGNDIFTGYDDHGITFCHGGYTWIVPANPNWELLPQALVKTDFHTATWEVMALARYNGVYWGGLGYRFQDAVSLLFGARPFYNSSNVYLKGLEAGLSYGITANKLGYRVHRSFGDVEVMVRYCFDIYKPEVFSGYGSSRSIYKNWY